MAARGCPQYPGGGSSVCGLRSLHVNETLKTAANVATPLGLIGLVVALLLFAYYRYLRGQERQILVLPEADRAKHVDLWYARVGLDISNLTRDQKFDFVRLELERR